MQTIKSSILFVFLTLMSSCKFSVNDIENGVGSFTISYSEQTPTYFVNTPIAVNVPSLTGTSTATFSVTPDLPTGLSLDTSTGVISGTPTAVSAQASYTVVGISSPDKEEAVSVLVMRVNPELPSGLALSSTDLNLVRNTPMTPVTSSVATGGTVTYSISPSLPAGLSLDSSTGTISGTPTAISSDTNYEVTATNISGSTDPGVVISIEVQTDVVVPPPNAPTGLSRQSPSTERGTDSTPTITISGVTAGDTITLYSDSGCTISKGSDTASGDPFNISSSVLADGVTTTFYAKASNVNGPSACSTANVSYTYDNTAPNAATSLGWTESTPYNGTTVTAAWTKSNSAELSNQKIQFYTNNTCTTTSGALIDLASNAETRSFTGSYGTTYYYTITSFDAAGNSTASSCSSAMNLNSAPVANDLPLITFNEDTAQLVNLDYIDTDLDIATTCTISSPTNITAGACSCAMGSCSVTVTGTANYNGVASFNYTVTAGGVVSNTASVPLSISVVNDAPTISDVSNQTTNDTATAAIAFTINDVETALTCASSVTATSSDTSKVAHASIVIGGTAPDCTATITPVANANGTPTITLTVTDGTTPTSDTFV